LLLGFTFIPLIGILQEFILRRITGYQALSRYELLDYFFPGALFGAILGASALQAFVSYRSGAHTSARRKLIGSGGLVCFLWACKLYPLWSSHLRGTSLIFGMRVPNAVGLFFSAEFAKNLSLQCALLMLVLGLLMRSDH
jgi:hypothetical protein